MSSNNRSSLDFYRLENQKLIETNMRGGITIEEYFSLEEILYNKTKAMHKEEIKEAWDNAAIDATYGNKFRNFEHYYNETFGGNK